MSGPVLIIARSDGFVLAYEVSLTHSIKSVCQLFNILTAVVWRGCGLVRGRNRRGPRSAPAAQARL